jgi:hypothetical protein
VELKLGGLIVIVLVLSAATVYTMAVLRGEESPVIMIQNDYPESMINPGRDGNPSTFSHGFLIRRNLVELEIRFSYIHNSPPPETENDSRGFKGYIDLKTVERHLGEDLLVRDVFTVEVVGEAEAEEIQVIDIGRTLFPFSPTGSADTISSVFAFREENDGDLSYYRGFSDFFYDREHNMEYLFISHGDSESYYSSGGEGGASISDAPEGGAVLLSDLRKGDVVVVEFSVFPDADHMPERTWNRNYERKIIEIIRVYADGELFITVANTVGVDLI